LQRGVGSSTNGAGAFGATVNIQTATSFKPFGLISQSYGSYDTRKTTIAAGTGLLNKHWTLDLRLSQIHSNGFIDRGASDLNSWFVSGGYFARKWSLKMLVFNGAEHTYQVWYGIPREKMFGNDSALRAHYDRNKGTVYKSVADSMNLFTSNKRSYNYFNYENESDRYSQTHYHLYFNTQINRRHSLNATLYKTLGGGYFEQFRFMDPLSSYNLPPVIFGTDTIRNSDIIRRRWLDNTLTGINANWLFRGNTFSLTTGGGYSQYLGNHFGEIVWARLAPAANHLGNYYTATGDKYDGNVFTKTVWNPVAGFQVTGDLQVRRVYHTGRGSDNDQRPIRFQGNYLFFNPKFGVSRSFGDGALLYTSVSMAGKEPARSDYTDNPFSYKPKPEKLLDYEFGFVKQNKKISTSVNCYFMDYKDQLVLTGAVNDVGTPLRTNINSNPGLSGLFCK
jgi:iron complex outermembrane receptor protein